MEETFKTAISRLTFGAIQGAIGGAAVGAVAGAILMSVNRNAMVGADASSLPIRVDYAWRDSEIVSMILAVLDIMPASAEEHRRGLVAAVDQLVGCAHNATTPGTMVLANRYFQHVVRILRPYRTNERATELYDACDNIVHNLCIE
jgi:hypothetical protein